MNKPYTPGISGSVPGNDFIIGDIHVPFQDDDAVNVVIKMARKFKPDNIVINGDLVDCNPLSSFSKEPIEPAAFKAEMDEACDIISDLQRYSNVVLIEGNHESRFYRYVNDKAPAHRHTAIIGAICSCFRRGCPIVFCGTMKDMAEMLLCLGKKHTDGKVRNRVVAKKTLEDKRVQLLCALGGVSSSIAESLLQRFGTVRAIFDASDEELQEVYNVGNKTAHNIKDVIN